jgi:hypothetical protein
MMIRRSYSIKVNAAFLFLVLVSHARAATVQTIGEGSAIVSVDRSATFDDLNFAGRETPLSDYRSGGLYIRTNGNSYFGDDARGTIQTLGIPFNPFHITIAADHSYVDVGGGFYFPYEAGPGNYDWVTIQTDDGRKIYALEFLYGNGWTTGQLSGPYPWGNSGAYLEWKTLVGGNVVSSGQANSLPVGSVVGFMDPDGFDQLMVRAPHPNSANPLFQELALDNLNVALSAGSSVPPFVPAFSEVTTPTQEIKFPQFAVGGGWESDLTLISQGGTESSGSIVFLTTTGQLMTVSVDGNAVNGRLDFRLLPKSLITYKLTGGSDAQAGWIIVSEVLSGAGAKGSISGILTFRYLSGGIVMSQIGVAGVRELRDAHLPYDNTNGNQTAFAVCSVPSNTLLITRFSADGTLQEQKAVDLAGLSQQALYAYQMFPASMDTAGYLTISGSQYFGLLAMNVNNSIWSGSAGLPAVYERQIDLPNMPNLPLKFILEGQNIYGVLESSPGVVNPVSGVITHPPSGGIILYLHMPFSLANGQTVMVVGMARISDLKFQDVQGTVTRLLENGTTQTGSSFHLYSLSSAQF